MIIRKSRAGDFPAMLEIYARARLFMAQTGNPNQWGPTGWPPEDLLREDISEGRSYVVEEEGKVIGTFCHIYGDHIDPTYDVIYDGEWSKDGPYGVIHRVASDGTKGVGIFVLQWAVEKRGYVRIDTHPDNLVMRNLLEKLGFRHCGTIFVEEDDFPRYAYDYARDADFYG